MASVVGSAGRVAGRCRSVAAVRAAVAVAVIAASCCLVAPASAAPVSPAKDPRLVDTYVDGEVIVEFVPGTAATARSRALASIGARASRQLSPLAPHAALVSLAVGRSTEAALTTLERNPNVRYVEPNYRVSTDFVSDDTLYSNGSLWGMYGDTTTPANQFGSQAAEAWAEGSIGSSSVYVGVIDEGLDYTHPDLAGNVWTNPVDPANGIDDDGNGYVDDVHGWDFDGNNNSVFDGSGDDHGTHVAGTIGGVGGNGTGVAGVNWDVTMISAKFLGSAGGTTANAILAVDYITALKNRLGLNIVATSNSWGGGGFSQGLLDAINRGGDAGILFVAAAGNSNANNDSGSYYPANYQCTTTSTGAPRGWDCMVTVAAIDAAGARASFSSYGATMVDLGAPGVGVTSTLPGGSYGAYSGTSMATPHVSGAVALCASMSPAMTASELRAAVLGSAAPTASMSGLTVTGGRLDVGSMAGQCTTPTEPVTGGPSALSATAQSAMAIRLDWIDGTSNETYHEVQQSTGDCTSWSSAATLGANSTSTVIGGLQASTTYCYRVRAGNRYDTGNGNSLTEWTAVATATTESAPDPYVCGAMPYRWTDHAGGTALTLGDDAATTVNVPFTIEYYGQAFTSVGVGSNGLVAFGSLPTAYTNTSLPAAGTPDGIVAPFWDDLNPGVGGSVLTTIGGTAPNRTFAVSWLNVPHYSLAGSSFTFQVVFDEATGGITFNYLDPVGGSATYDRGASATVGLESPTGVFGTLVGFNRASIGDRTSVRCSTEPTDVPSIATASLPNGAVQNAYTATVEVVGGTAPYSWAATSGSLPSGLTLSSTAGVISGTPTTQGASTVAIRVTDAGGRTAAATLTLTVDLGLYIDTGSLPAAGQGAAYSTTLVALNGTAPYAWTSTALPAGLSLSALTGDISGTPTASGTFSVTFSVTDASTPTRTASRTLTLVVSAAPVVSTTVLQPGTIGIALTRTILASGGSTPLSWALTAGSLQPGLSFSTGGVISGTPTAGGTATFTVSVTDAFGRVDDQQLSLTVDPLFVVTTSSLPEGGVGHLYSAALVATGGSGGYTWSITGSLPAGLSVSTAGEITGTPTTLGSSTFTVVARDTSSRSSTRSLTIVIAAAPTITTTSLNNALTTSTFNYTLVASAGAGAESWSVVGGSLPAGASLSTSGVLSGTVTTVGSYTFSVRATDTLGRSDDQDLTLVVVTPVSVTTSSLAAGTTGSAYSLTLAATGGSGAYTWSATGVPSGLTLSSAGVLSGTPAVAGSSTVTFTVTDNGTPVRTATRSLALVVSAALTITTASINSVSSGSSFSFTLASSGGSGTKTWSVLSGSLPTGASLSTGGVLSGNVASAGSYPFTVRVTDGALRTADQPLTLVVVSPVAVSTASLPEATVGAVFNAVVSATGGTGVYTWSATGLPAGVAIDASSGAISGTPTAAGTSTVSLTATDNGSPVRTATRSLSLVVVAALGITTATLPGATQGVAYTTSLTATGGSGTRTWSVTAGALPSGLALSSGGTISGTPSAAGSFSFTVTVSDTGGRSASKALSITVVSSSLTMKVSSLSIARKVAKTGISGTATVNVVNGNGVALGSVTVTGVWTVSGISGSTTRSAVTSTRGTATITSTTYTGITGRTVQFCITSLVRSGYTFDTSGPTCATFTA